MKKQVLNWLQRYGSLLVSHSLQTTSYFPCFHKIWRGFISFLKIKENFKPLEFFKLMSSPSTTKEGIEEQQKDTFDEAEIKQILKVIVCCVILVEAKHQFEMDFRKCKQMIITTLNETIGNASAFSLCSINQQKLADHLVNNLIPNLKQTTAKDSMGYDFVKLETDDKSLYFD